MKIYEFLYCECVWESSSASMSLHRTKKGAYMAMRKHLMQEYERWQNMRTKYGKDKISGIDKFGQHQMWHVGEQELME